VSLLQVSRLLEAGRPGGGARSEKRRVASKDEVGRAENALSEMNVERE